MPYVGNEPTSNFASVTKDSFSGDGSTTAFTLSKASTTNGVAVFVENVRQEPTIAYAVSGTTLTFTAAPVTSSGNNIYVLHHNAVASTANHPAAQDLTAVKGTFTGAFTSLGIDDNANATSITIDSAENVGILNTSPSSYGNAHELVVGNHSIDDAGITIATTTGSSARFQFADNTSSPFIGAIEYAHNTNAMMFYTNAAKKFEISTNGKFTLTHGGNEDGVVYTNSNDSNGGSHIKLESYRSATGNFWFMQGVSDSDGTPDREFRITGEGEFFSDASAYNTGAGDYAEYFEWKDGNSSSEDRRGYPVVLDSDNKIRKATSDDAKANIIGIVSANPAVVGDNPDSWKGKFVRDDYNGIVKEEYTLTQWEVDAKNSVGADIKETKSYHTDRIPSDVTAPSDAVVKTKDEDGNTLMRRKMNPDYDRSKTWIPRSERKEWDAIGLMGKLFLRKGQPTGDRWIKMRSISDAIEEWLVR